MIVYDTTLRDGMQGQGMSLSAAERVRVVQALDRLGIAFIEAGFPSSNPKEGELHPHLRDIELVDYKVRILDSHHGTGAVTRVLLDASDGHRTWGSIGVSENIIEASWEALVESLEHAFQPSTAAAEETTGSV